ncbi:OmpA family protein [Mucilaginibacter sp. KACC 22063]|uniref:OmpA family protein n=1 Tax=Mucilaginibacter sp. KACC 22063 TaxID=3025666 RepID=UPI002365F169|nr:OmpA family protein [Mucilaginibacter sp. KACC 22063]WDF53975.1 OmpA family protein [Mucilaginibacter sp. KACC 22063]
MKINFNKSLLLLSALLAGNKLMAQTDSLSKSDYVQPFAKGAQFRTWSIGVDGGLLTPYTIFRGHDDYRTPNSNVGYGAYVRNQFSHSFAGQLSFFRGNVEGTGPVPSAEASIRDSYKTQINYAVDLSGQFTLANISWRNQQNAIQPYFSAGFGLMGFQPKLRAVGTNTEVDYKPNGSVKAAYIPVGLGLRFNLGDVVGLNVGYQVNFVDGDNFDGYTIGSSNDKFSYAHIGLEFALGKRSKPQLVRHNPVNSMRTEYLVKDMQLQNQLDAERAANQQLRNDLNNTNANLSALNSKLTADSDGDGVPDIYDKCPNTPAGTKVDGAGCPLAPAKIIITEEDKRVVREAIKNLEFDFGKATIKAHSYASLDRVAEILMNKNFSLKLAGHTDNVGSDAANMKLSKDRAEAVKSYLVSKGANESRIEAVGYGETQPIASNKTAAGRQKNRRVEFTLY